MECYPVYIDKHYQHMRVKTRVYINLDSGKHRKIYNAYQTLTTGAKPAISQPTKLNNDLRLANVKAFWRILRGITGREALGTRLLC